MLSDLMGMHRISLIGREKHIKRIFEIALRAEKRRSAAFIYLEGGGGIGKTAILEEIQNRLSGNGNVVIANELVDLYHLDNRTSYGFSEAIVKAFSVRRAEFRRLGQSLEKFNEARERGHSDYDKLWEEVEREFVRAFQKIADRQQVWVMLDTAETLHLDHSSTAMDAGIETEHVSNWLLKILPQLARIPLLFLAAGRPPRDVDINFFSQIRKLPGWMVEDPIELGPLESDECRDYLDTVAMYLEQRKAGGAERIRGYLGTYGHVPLHRETGGRPLYLAMTSDILRTGGTLPEGFYLSENTDGSDEKDRQMLTDHFMNLRSPIGITLRFMAMLHKGVDVNLLSKVMLIEKNIAEQYLKAIEDLTLVKRLQGDVPRPYFLHDEIYDLYARRVIFDKEPNAVYKHIQDYYEETLMELEREMRQRPHLLTRSQRRRRTAQIEQMHYALWFYPWQGFAEYFSQSSNALSMHRSDLDSILKDEFHHTQLWLERLGRFPDELKLYVFFDEKLRTIERVSIIKNNAYKTQTMLLEMTKDIQSAPAFCQAYWWFLHGILSLRGQLYTSRLSNPDVSFDEVERQLVMPVPDSLGKAVKVLQAFIENYRGYSARRAGKYKQAIKHYQRAAAVMRQFDFGGLSGVLTNQAYAMSMLGLDRRARETVREAYEVAQRADSPRDQIRALNVRASVEILAGDAQSGQWFATKAFEILKYNPEPRLDALVYISLGRACRYEWNQELGEVYGEVAAADPYFELIMKGLTYFEGEEKVKDILSPAREMPHIESGAIALLSDTPDVENLVQALNECGCLWREVTWLWRHKYGKQDVRVIQISQITESRLKKAAGIQDIAEENWLHAVKSQTIKIGGSPYWPALALANLAWHYHYQRKPAKEVEKICQLVENLVANSVGDRYLWKETPPNISQDDADMMVWAALGKMEMARAYEALRNWRDDPFMFEEATKHIALSMEYNYLMGQTSFNMRRAEMGLENRIRQSEHWEKIFLPSFYEVANRVTNQLRLPEDRSPRLLRWLEERFGPPEDWKKPYGGE
ncbi:MAG: AAA family ATPase [Chloroflexota bacterium]